MYLQNFYLEFINGDRDLTFKEFFVNALFFSKRAALGASMALIWDKYVNQFTCDVDKQLGSIPNGLYTPFWWYISQMGIYVLVDRDHNATKTQMFMEKSVIQKSTLPLNCVSLIFCDVMKNICIVDINKIGNYYLTFKVISVYDRDLKIT